MIIIQSNILNTQIKLRHILKNNKLRKKSFKLMMPFIFYAILHLYLMEWNYESLEVIILFNIKNDSQLHRFQNIPYC